MKQEMQSPQIAGSKPTVSTQSLLDIAEIKEGTVVLKDGSLRAVVVISATNFSLKSSDEQNALIQAYQSFLNSLEYPIQILMQSRKLDINSYIEKLHGIMQQQTNELLRLQTEEYTEYITKLVEFASIMNKTFYIIVPFSIESAKSGFFQKLGLLFNPAGNITVKQQDFITHKEALSRRVEQVISALSGMGLRTITLNTEELVELYYNSYNLNTASPIRIKNIDDLELQSSDEEGNK